MLQVCDNAHSINEESKMADTKTQEIIHDLEGQFQKIQQKIGEAKDSYLASHEKEYNKTKKSFEQSRKKLDAARKKTRAATERATKSGSDAAKSQLKKTRAAVSLLADSAVEAKKIMATAEDKLKTAKPFEKKLAARTKALEAFEKDWAKQEVAKDKQKVKRAIARKKAAQVKKKAAAVKLA
jgi:hypothetical protein